ncbi:MAG: 2-dehydro-3-deoxyphosphogalactonate aldolase, partial [uncultured Sphingomonas sp.]
ERCRRISRAARPQPAGGDHPRSDSRRGGGDRRGDPGGRDRDHRGAAQQRRPAAKHSPSGRAPGGTGAGGRWDRAQRQPCRPSCRSGRAAGGLAQHQPGGDPRDGQGRPGLQPGLLHPVRSLYGARRRRAQSQAVPSRRRLAHRAQGTKGRPAAGRAGAGGRRHHAGHHGAMARRRRERFRPWRRPLQAGSVARGDRSQGPCLRRGAAPV